MATFERSIETGQDGATSVYRLLAGALVCVLLLVPAIRQGLGQTAGSAHPTQPHVVSQGNGEWMPADGYTWVNAGAPGDLRVKPLPDGTPHKTLPHVVWNGHGLLRAADNYRFVNLNAPGDARLQVEMIPGTPHPSAPHIVWRADGWVPADGYTWVNEAARANLQVKPVPDGTPHGTLPNLVWNGNGLLRAAANYRFVNLNAPGDERFKVELIPGSSHPSAPHIVWRADGWVPEDGYMWVNEATRANLQVKPVPDGTPHATLPNVVWNGSGLLRAADNYRFVNLDAPGMERYNVERVIGSAHPTQPHVIWASKGWHPQEGYTWVDATAQGDLRAVPIPDGTPYARFPHVVWAGNGMLRAADNYRFVDLNAPGEERFRVEPASVAVATTATPASPASPDVDLPIMPLPAFGPGTTVVAATIEDGELGSLRPMISGTNIVLRGPPTIVDEVKSRLRGAHQIQLTIQNEVGQNVIQPIYFWAENGKLTRYQDAYISGKAYAVVIGVGGYHVTDPRVDDLPEAPNQARALGWLLDSMGFQVKYFVDDQTVVSKQLIEDYLFKELNPKLDPTRDRVFIYFGGHGTTQTDFATNKSTGYLLPHVYDPKNISSTAISMKDDVAGRYSSSLRAKHVLFAIDACVASVGFRSVPATDEQLQRFKTLAMVQARTTEAGRTIMTAGSEDDNAIDDNGGIFTKALIRGLRGEADRDKNGVIELDELELFVYGQVVANAKYYNLKQRPKRIDIPSRQGEMVFFYSRK